MITRSSATVIGILLVSGAVLAGVAAASDGREGKGRGEPALPAPRITTDVSLTTNLIHWVDNLAGTSVGKTMPVYQRYWRERFGPTTQEDRDALAAFARIRRLPMAVPTPAVNPSGCIPLPAPVLEWHQIFLVEAMRARSINGLRRGLAPYLSARDLQDLTDALERFRPRFEQVWRDLGHVRAFEPRFNRFLKRGDLLRYLATVAAFLGVDPAAMPPMEISFIGLPENGPTHAEADGDNLLIEIRPQDSPQDQIQVVAHEASHFLMKRMTPEQLDRMARQAWAEGESGALVWTYMWEGIPTALGQGLAEARLSPARFSFSQPWYHLGMIDDFAKAIYPAVAQAVGDAETIQDGLMTRITRVVRDSSLRRQAKASEFLRTAFFASGRGMGDVMESLRSRLGLGRHGAAIAFALDDPAGADLVHRYTCLGGVALVSPGELDAAARLTGAPLASAEAAQEVRERAERGLATIALGRRSEGGIVFYLVAPGPQSAAPLVEAFAALRGVPSSPVVLPEGQPSSP